MKKLLFFIVLFFLFLFIFFKSQTWQSYKTTETRRGMPYTVVKHRLHWDRFFGYIKGVPGQIRDSFPKI